MSTSEMARVERLVGAPIPADLVVLLATGLPTGEHFPNWRDGDESELRKRVTWPVDGILFDVQVNGYWHDEWPTRPEGVEDAVALGRALLGSVPRLVPVVGHSYLAADRPDAGNPVYSCHQADILVLGADLLDYFQRRFGFPAAHDREGEPRPVAFWSRIASN